MFYCRLGTEKMISNTTDFRMGCETEKNIHKKFMERISKIFQAYDPRYRLQKSYTNLYDNTQRHKRLNGAPKFARRIRTRRGGKKKQLQKKNIDFDKRPKKISNEFKSRFRFAAIASNIDRPVHVKIRTWPFRFRSARTLKATPSALQWGLICARRRRAPSSGFPSSTRSRMRTSPSAVSIARGCRGATGMRRKRTL